MSGIRGTCIVLMLVIAGCGVEPEPAVFERGVAALEAGDAEAAVRAFDAVLAETPGEPEALVNRGLAREALGQRDRALEDYSAALAIDDEYQDAYVNRGAARLAAGDPNGAIDDFNRAITLDPEDADAYRNRGFAWHAMEEWDATIVDMTRSIVLSDALDPVVFRDRADAWKAKGDLEQAASDYAIADCTDALLATPDDLSARLSRGAAFRDIGAFELALVDLDEALRLDPKSAAAWLVRGDVHFLSDASELALEDYARAIEVDARYVPARVSRADLLEAGGEWSAAQAEYARALELDPDHAGAASGLGWLLATSPVAADRDGARAMALLRPFCEASKWEDWALLDVYAAAAAEAGAWDEAARWAAVARDLAPDDFASDIAERLAGYESKEPYRLHAEEDTE